MTQELIMATSLTMGLLAYALIARWYVLPALAERPLDEALVPLIIPHMFRYIGLGFLLSGVTSPDIHQGFAQPAAYGDLIAALLAALTVVALKSRWTVATPLVWLFTLVGSLDLLYAVTTGVRTVPAGQFGGMYFVPALVVPGLLVTHALVAHLAWRRVTCSRAVASTS